MAEWENDDGASPKARIYSFQDGRKMDINVEISSGSVHGILSQDGTINLYLVLSNS